MCTPDAALGSINAGAAPTPAADVFAPPDDHLTFMTLFFLSPVGDFSSTGASVHLILR